MADTLLGVFLDRAARRPERVALRTLRAGGAEADDEITWRAWADSALRVAAGLAAAGHAPGDAVGILAGNRPIWPIADVGALAGGYVTVGLYPTAAPAQVRQVLADAEARVVVVDTPEQLAKVLAVRDELPALRTVVSAAPVEAPGVVALSELLAQASEGGVAAAEARARAARPDDVAILIYTSGSTGEPKGARITHRCLAASAASIRDALGLVEADTSLSFLPYCHASERIFGLYTRILVGMEAGLVADHTRIWEASRAYGPTLFGGLPRFYEKAYEALRSARAELAGAEAARWDRVLELGRAISRSRRAGEPVPPAAAAEWRELGEPVFARVRALFGGRLRLATSGGATLPAEVAEYLDALGVTVLGAYGLTEHLCAAMNRADRYTFDSVGPAMPGTELRIGDDGEVQIRRGPLTFDGYQRRPAESAEAFTPDGAWLRTGDLGTLDERGFLRITGRRKELIALSTGKKVAPLPIEARLEASPWIARAVVCGEGRKFLSALLTLRRPVVEAWGRKHAPGVAFPALLRHPGVVAHVQAAVDAVNRDLSSTESVRRFALLEHELTVEAGELTPTMKVRRAVIAARYHDLLEEIYGG
ncbi:MAG: long-chain fatty acid--CoA ligase [Gemmatimonadetes bacterium]|nr:long-chain fatty acid--CoA ligase [Gemmatimonadota bacterium]